MSKHDHVLDDRLRKAYVAASHASHVPGSGLVQIHVGHDVWAYLLTLADVIDPDYIGVSPKMWGFPLVEIEDIIDLTRIEVHTVQIH